MPTDDLEQRALAETTERIGRINGLLRKTAADHITLGLELHQLHNSLRQGWKARIYSDSKDPLPGTEPLDITQADGEQLIRIAKNRALSDSRNSEKLPWAKSTLDVLSKLPPDTVQAAIDRGDIIRKLRCDEAERLVSKLTGQPEAERDDVVDWNYEVQERRLTDRIFAAVEPYLAACEPETGCVPAVAAAWYSKRLSFAEEVLRRLADDLQEGRERRESLDRSGALSFRTRAFDYLADAARRLDELAQQRAAAIQNDQRSLADASIRKLVIDLDLPESYTAQRAMRAIQHVLTGRICDRRERAVMERAARQASGR